MTNEVSRDELMNCYSDLHKDVWGCRPMSHTMQWVRSMSDAQFNEHWDGLVATLMEQEEEDRERSEQSMYNLIGRIETLVSPTTSRQDVLRWLADAGGNCYHGVYDWDQTLFENGVRHIPHQRKVKDWVGIEYSNEPAVFCAG